MILHINNLIYFLSSCCQKINSFYYFMKIRIISMTTNLWPGECHKITWQVKSTKGNKEWRTILEAFFLSCNIPFSGNSVQEILRFPNKGTRWIADFIRIYRDSKCKPKFHPKPGLNFSTGQIKPLKENLWFSWNTENLFRVEAMHTDMAAKETHHTNRQPQ